MNFIECCSEYRLKLNDNTVTDEFRKNLLSLVTTDDEYRILFKNMLFKKLEDIFDKDLDKKECLQFIKIEYEKLNLESKFGAYEEFEKYFDFLINEIYIDTENENFILFKKVIDYLDTTKNFSLKIGGYQAIVKFITEHDLLLNDVDFTSKVVNFVESNENNTDSLSEVMKSLTELVFFKFPSI